MKTFRIVRQSIRAIGRNKGRSFLTMLGIIIGITSVITLIALGNGAQSGITNRISQLGTTTLTIRSGAGFGPGGFGGNRGQDQAGPPGGGGGIRVSRAPTLTPADLQALKDGKTSYNLTAVAATISDTSTFTLNSKNSSGQAQQQDYNVTGTEPDYFKIQDLTLGSGRLFTGAEVTAKAKVAIIGPNIANDLFGTDNPIGKTIVIEKDTYTIIGETATKTESGFNNPNNQLYIPYTSHQITYAATDTNLSTIYAEVNTDANVNAAETAITAKLQALHGKTDQTRDFNISSPQDLLKTASQATDTFRVLLVGIAAISLVVGGIGIMNIMLVAVTERTREIGLRKAVGARTGHILLQFMIEAILLCVVGGIIGVAISFGLTHAMSNGIRLGGRGFGGGTIKPVITASSILLAVAVSSVIGLIFGIYPAAKAARLNPIDALRYE